MLNKKQKGNLTELQCISAFYNMGYSVSIPYGENNRYDFIADVNGILLKIQVKTASSRDNGKTFDFSCRSSRINSKKVYSKKYSKKEIDYFATYIYNKCYLLPVEECSTSKRIRFEKTLNNQDENTNFEENYRLEKQIELLLNNKEI